MTAVRVWLGNFFDIDVSDRVKVAFLSIFYFLVVGAYTIARELKDSIFTSVVGKEYVPTAKILVMFALIPAVLLYAKLVDRMRRLQLFALCSAFFGVGGICIVYLLGHPVIGLYNTDASPFRIFGWLVYFFVEGYSPFLVSVLWAFVNSVSSPEGAKKSYPLIVAASKLGGILTSGFAWYVLHKNVVHYAASIDHDVYIHQIILAVSSIMLLCIPFLVWFMIRMVPMSQMHGYEAAYQAEQKHEGEKVGMFSGLVLLFKYPYVLGIFSMVFFYEVTNTVLSFLRLGVAQSYAKSLADMSSVLFGMIFITHVVGLFISLLGTRALLRNLGERVCLMLVPLMIGSALLCLMLYPTLWVFITAYVALKAINYAFSWPVRESLYVPTVKDIKYKSRSWIDVFGGKFARATGSIFNQTIVRLGDSLALTAQSFFFAGVIGFWFLAAYLLGRRFEWAVEHNEVIGVDKDEKNRKNGTIA